MVLSSVSIASFGSGDGSTEKVSYDVIDVAVSADVIATPATYVTANVTPIVPCYVVTVSNAIVNTSTPACERLYLADMVAKNVNALSETRYIIGKSNVQILTNCSNRPIRSSKHIGKLEKADLKSIPLHYLRE